MTKNDLLMFIIHQDIHELFKEQAQLSKRQDLAESIVKLNKLLEEENLTAESSIHEFIEYLRETTKKMSRANRQNSEVSQRKQAGLESVFNILNGNRDSLVYEPITIEAEKRLALPSENISLEYSWNQLASHLLSDLNFRDRSNQSINQYLQIMESETSYLPSTDNKEAGFYDLSFYDYTKLNLAIASSIYDFAQDVKHTVNEAIEENTHLNQESLLLCSLDFSGIQSFIYKVTKENALKQLRSRSFYLEILLEIVIDELLNRLTLTRANIIYLGGGHAYLLLANTGVSRKVCREVIEEVNQWLVDLYGTDLYLAYGLSGTSISALSNEPEGSYAQVFKNLSKDISAKKLCKYSLEQLQKWNEEVLVDDQRECKICYRPDYLKADNICKYCESIISVSNAIMENDIFLLVDEAFESKKAFLYMPFRRRLYFTDQEEYESHYFDNRGVLRVYSKNQKYLGPGTTNLWLADYASTKLIEELTADKGIQRIGVLRADVDNLGKTMVAGFPETLQSLSRTSTLSRQLSMFFKFEVNHILENPRFFIHQERERQVIIIYSGGDDVFAIGGWDDIISFAIDLRRALKEYSQDTLTLSAGIGMYHSKYPLFNMAQEVGELEDIAKSYIETKDGQILQKNAVCIFSPDYVTSWDNFEYSILGEKLKLIVQIQELMAGYKKSQSSGFSFLYKWLDLYRDMEESNHANIARLAYLLGRHEPSSKDEKLQEEYSKLTHHIYRWASNPKDRFECIIALYIFIYSMRGVSND